MTQKVKHTQCYDENSFVGGLIEKKNLPYKRKRWRFCILSIRTSLIITDFQRGKELTISFLVDNSSVKKG